MTRKNKIDAISDVILALLLTRPEVHWHDIVEKVQEKVGIKNQGLLVRGVLQSLINSNVCYRVDDIFTERYKLVNGFTLDLD